MRPVLLNLTENPFQTFPIESFAYCKDVAFDNDENEAFEDDVRDLEREFEQTVQDGNYKRFIGRYTSLSVEMLKRTKSASILKPVLEDALVRLIVFLNYRRMRSRAHFAETDSVHVFNFDTKVLTHARAQTDKMEQLGIKNMEYDLSQSPEIKSWVRKTLQPMIEEYVGFKIVSPGAETRFADSKMHAEGWEDAYRHHDYGNYHLDQSCYAFPLIIYLDDVSEKDGPFTYVDRSDKYPQNYILRALHQALTFRSKIGGLNDSDFKLLGKLPSVFRGGDLVGAFTGPSPFERSKIVNFTGPAGKAVLFQGFHLVHSGGHPTGGRRRSLFVNFRYPRFKAVETAGKAAAMYWRHRARNV